jgi:hypothetical protein
MFWSERVELTTIQVAIPPITISTPSTMEAIDAVFRMVDTFRCRGDGIKITGGFW